MKNLAEHRHVVEVLNYPMSRDSREFFLHLFNVRPLPDRYRLAPLRFAL